MTLGIAAQMDGERKGGKVRGPLHGIPDLLKDNIATGDKMATTAGSLALDGVRAVRDAHVAAKLRAYFVFFRRVKTGPHSGCPCSPGARSKAGSSLRAFSNCLPHSVLREVTQ